MPAPGLTALDSLFPVLNLLRTNGPITRTELVHQTGPTRKVVVQRIEELIASGLVEEGDVGRSTGGRAPREIRFRTEAGTVMVAEFSSGSIAAGLTDLAGVVLAEAHVDTDPHFGPGAALDLVEQLFDTLLQERPAGSPPVFGIGIGVPAPVAVDTGRVIGDLSYPDWVNYPLRERLASRYDVPVWVQNNANLMALGELRAGLARHHGDILFIRFGNGIGSAVISSGKLQRGSQGFAGEFGHVSISADTCDSCWCGLTGCLTQVAGAAALSRQGDQAAADGTSPILAAIKAQGRSISAREVFTAASAGDPTSTRILTTAGQHLGAATAVLVGALNPSLILLDASQLTMHDPYMQAFRNTVLERSLPSATTKLQFAISPLSNSAGLIGAAYLVVDELLSPKNLKQWSGHGTPTGLADQIQQNATDTTDAA